MCLDDFLEIVGNLQVFLVGRLREDQIMVLFLSTCKTAKKEWVRLNCHYLNNNIMYNTHSYSSK